MILGNLSIEYLDRLYNALLSLYPPRFRIRFGPEMLQLFRDCSRDALEKGEVAVIVVFWLQVMRDLFFSVVRERGREILGPGATENPLMSIIDVLLIPSMVTVKLVALGPIFTLMFRNGARISPEQFVMISAFFSLGIGALAVVSSLVFNRLRPNVRLWVKLSA
jgi:hypothetical protein